MFLVSISIVQSQGSFNTGETPKLKIFHQMGENKVYLVQKIMYYVDNINNKNIFTMTQYIARGLDGM